MSWTTRIDGRLSWVIMGVNQLSWASIVESSWIVIINEAGGTELI